MFITRSSGMSYAPTTSTIAQWKDKPISFRKPGDIGCFAAVAHLLVKPILRKIDWHHEKSKFKHPPFSFNKVWSFAKTSLLPIVMAMLQLTTHPAFIRTLSSNSDGRRVFTPRSFLGGSLSNSFSTLAFLNSSW